jgi:hypothetical protein
MEKYQDLDYMTAYYRVVDIVVAHGGPDTSGTVRVDVLPAVSGFWTVTKCEHH